MPILIFNHILLQFLLMNFRINGSTFSLCERGSLHANFVYGELLVDYRELKAIAKAICHLWNVQQQCPPIYTHIGSKCFMDLTCFVSIFPPFIVQCPSICGRKNSYPDSKLNRYLHGFYSHNLLIWPQKILWANAWNIVSSRMELRRILFVCAVCNEFLVFESKIRVT